MLSLGETAEALGARREGGDARFDRVTTDSRSVIPGDLFVALKGPRFDGHAYLQAAAGQGAVGALIEGGVPAPVGLPVVRVADTRLALGTLAAHWRARFVLPLVAVTGSNGKTSVKEMLSAIFRAAVALESPAAGNAVLATTGNLNNDIGMPLTLLGLGTHHRFAVIEMGMNHPGELAYLTRLAQPVVALINNAQAAHLEGLTSVEAVARAKGEILEGLGDAGIAVLNADDPHVALWRTLAGPRRVLDFGLDAPASVNARYELSEQGSHLELTGELGDASLRLRVPGLHNVRNATAAATAALAAGVPLAAVVAGLEAFAGVRGRLQRREGLNGATLIDDTYNANPESVKAAIQVLALAPGRKILVLGDMGELGADAAALHAGIGLAAREAGIDGLLALGDLSTQAVHAFGRGARHFERIEELLAELELLMAPGVTVLVKGSRFMQMERVVKGFEVVREVKP
ncbi:MAG: UDP-N-acetylmuramoyl-tripeptide--D-alanyl-D-alanine ligase [Betaproteobacteria bacterium]|nr:UDP-N-acetylmuramoyl-tripeptide--D-alanyl-D-alanine ligase [Betaproteobacteria bacterium]